MSDEQNDKSLSWEFKNEKSYISGVDIDIKDQVVGIWVEDNYYDFDIPFDKFLEIAEKVKEQIINEKRNNAFSSISY